MSKERIKDLNMSLVEVFHTISGGNPGALNVCIQLFQHGAKIDPDAAFGGFAGLLSLDALGIHDSRIWMLYKDVCGQDIVKVIALLRAYQLGQLAGVTEAALNHAIDNYGDGIDVDAALAAVMERLPHFNRQSTLSLV